MEPAEVLREKNVTLELTRERYLEHKQAGMADSEIRKKYGFKFPNDLTNWKKKNGLEGYRVNVLPEQRIHIHEPQHTNVQKNDQQQESLQEHPAPEEQPAETHLSPLRKSIIELLQAGKTVVEAKEEAFRLVNVLEAMEFGWQIGGKAGKYWVSLIEV
ncbi:hypothetical protein [Brevibacillus sp. H7]|uniref:hypothetical protein n=1 Tax=Brevibacillus sp. H7 TaxID=3349138 RepID=UPI0037FC41D6